MAKCGPRWAESVFCFLPSEMGPGEVFGLTALFSSTLIYNIQSRIQEDKLDNLDYFTTSARTAPLLFAPHLPASELLCSFSRAFS